MELPSCCGKLGSGEGDPARASWWAEKTRTLSGDMSCSHENFAIILVRLLGPRQRGFAAATEAMAGGIVCWQSCECGVLGFKVKLGRKRGLGSLVASEVQDTRFQLSMEWRCLADRIWSLRPGRYRTPDSYSGQHMRAAIDTQIKQPSPLFSCERLRSLRA